MKRNPSVSVEMARSNRGIKKTRSGVKAATVERKPGSTEMAYK